MADSLFRANPQLPRIAQQFQQRANRAVERVWIALQKWANEWSRRAARVTPVETGMLRQSFFVVPIRNGAHMTVILANHMQYGKWLEFGTRYIAHGHVLAWKMGDPPVMQWPAKFADLQQPSLRAKQSTHDRWSARITKAMTPGAGEQMPMVRPTGHELVPQIIADVTRIIREEMGKAA